MVELKVQNGQIRAVRPKKPPRRLTNPARDLWQEVTNDRATWTDATFWFVLGVVVDALIEVIVNVAMK